MTQPPGPIQPSVNPGYANRYISDPLIGSGQISASWPAGTVITPCPNCYLTGNGHQGATTGVGNADSLVFTDGIHPSPAGHLMLGAILGQAYAAQLNS